MSSRPSLLLVTGERSNNRGDRISRCMSALLADRSSGTSPLYNERGARREGFLLELVRVGGR